MARELIGSFDNFDNDPENPKFLFTIVVWREGDHIYTIKHPEQQFDLQSLEAPDPIPAQKIWANWPSGVHEASNPISASVFLKGPQFADVALGIHPGQRLVKEALIYEEVLSRYPHPALCVYQGCLREGELLKGICLQKHRCDLWNAVTHQTFSFDPEQVLGDIASGLLHLHSLGLAHNDVKPSNVVLTEEGHAVLIDFESCIPEGEPVMRGGTWDFAPEGGWKTSSRDNDLYGFERIEEWMGEHVNFDLEGKDELEIEDEELERYDGGDDNENEA